MKALKAMTLPIVLLAIFGVSVIAQDADNDGIPDRLDRRPHVAGYYYHSGIARTNPANQAAGVDSDNDGIPDRLDASPWVAEYYHHSGLPKYDPSQVPIDVDTDNDGIPDRWDSRPSVATYYHAKGYAVATSAQADSDRDGVPDWKDKCPGTPIGAIVDASGCPKDSDNDGVFDGLDRCPNTPSGAKVNASGCPITDDSDSDGVPDSQDKCPNTPAGVRVDALGCPLDSDNDGVPDYLDKCPTTPRGIPVDSVGCPKLVKKGEKITLEIEYATNSYEPDAKSKEILNGIAQTIKDFPEIKIAVKGFTDNAGSEAHNKRLSENRAKGVFDYLAEQGVKHDRMSAKGFGENPKYFVGDNNTEAGRQKNRRVEIESVD